MAIPSSVPRRLITVEDYHRMGEAGIFTHDERVELVEGELIQTAPIGGDHAWIVNYVNMTMARQVPEGFVVQIRGPLTLPPHSEPQPDVLVVGPECVKRRKRILAADALLVVEVSHSMLAFDRDTKARLYARHRVREYWVVDVGARAVLVMSDPHDLGYANVRSVAGDTVLVPSHVPGVQVDFAKAWG